MPKTFQKEFQIPLPTKMTLVGLRVETGQTPSQTLRANMILLEDEWKVQIIYVPYGQRQDKTQPSLYEHIITWKQELEQEKEFLKGTKIVYKRKVHSISNNTRAIDSEKYVLDLVLEVTLDAEVISDEAVSVQSAVKSTAFTYANLDSRLSKIEKTCEEMQTAVSLLHEKVNKLENYTNSLKTGRIFGQILDSFRLVPITKAIIEISPDNEEPIIKTASDNHGKYALENIPQGSYQIMIKHPRYLPFLITGYHVAENENKSQDFLMRRA